MASINFTDGIGAASLSNAFIFPGSRFKNWTPAYKPFGEQSRNLATGALNVTAFRDDLTVALEIPGIPNSDQPKALRLQMHLKRGGAVTVVAAPDVTIPILGTCKLAPGADVQIQLSDKTMLEYTFSTVLRSTSGIITSPDGTTDWLIWLKADIPFWPSHTLPADASLMGRWNDVTGGGNHGFPPGVAPKAHSRFDLVVQNGKPGVWFDANNYGDATYAEVDRFVLPWGALLPAQFTSLEGFFVLKRNSDYLLTFESGGPSEMGAGNIGIHQNGHYPRLVDGHVIDTFGSAVQQDAGAPGIDFGVAHIYNPASTYGIGSTGTWQARFNGVLTADLTGISYGVPDPLVLNTAVQVGATKPGGDNSYHGWMLEVVVCSPKRTTAQRADWMSYFATKWGITLP